MQRKPTHRKNLVRKKPTVSELEETLEGSKTDTQFQIFYIYMGVRFVTRPKPTLEGFDFEIDSKVEGFISCF